MKRFNFDIIIATYNRPQLVYSLVGQILSCNRPLPNKIIVVDSSDTINNEIQKLEKVVYVHSSHKNQPYQRYLGCFYVHSDIVVFLDDDLTIINKNIWQIIAGGFLNKEVAGVSVKMIMEKLDTKKINNKYYDIFATFTGAPKLKPGKIWFAGLRGDFPESTDYVSSFTGAVMAFRYHVSKLLFSNLLFYFFENRMAMGEDKYISMGALKYGKLLYSPEICLQHPANDSHYFQNVYSFAKKELFSRLWLSKRYVQIKNKSLFFAYIHYYWYAIWRIIIAGGDLVIHPQKNKFDKLKGRIAGVCATFINWEKKSGAIDWEKEIARDIKLNKK